MEIKLPFLLTIAVLLVHGDSLNWEGTGNMSRENMTVIKSYIEANLTHTWDFRYITGNNFPLKKFCQAFSTELNRQWDQAWNVIAVHYADQQNHDAVVYGYAFRDHWHWYSGILFDDGYYASIVLWKDYNCNRWMGFAHYSSDKYQSYDTSSDSFLNGTILPIMNDVNAVTPSSTNIWQAALNLGRALETNTKTKDYAFTVVTSNGKDAEFYGYFCAKDYAVLVDSDFIPLMSIGMVFLLQIR